MKQKKCRNFKFSNSAPVTHHAGRCATRDVNHIVCDLNSLDGALSSTHAGGIFFHRPTIMACSLGGFQLHRAPLQGPIGLFRAADYALGYWILPNVHTISVACGHWVLIVIHRYSLKTHGRCMTETLLFRNLKIANLRFRSREWTGDKMSQTIITCAHSNAIFF